MLFTQADVQLVMLFIELLTSGKKLPLEYHSAAWELLDAIQIQRKQEKS